MISNVGNHRWENEWKYDDDIYDFEKIEQKQNYGNLATTLIPLFITSFLIIWQWKRRRHHSAHTGEPHPVVPTTTEQPPSSLQDSGRREVDVQPTVSIYIDTLVNPEKTIVELETENGPKLSLVDIPKGLIDICKNSKIIFISKVESDNEEDMVRQFLREKLPFVFWDQVDLPDHVGLTRFKKRILFSSTVDGRISMIRQINPTIHIDTSKHVVTSLTGKISNVVFLDTTTNASILEDCALVIKGFTDT